MRNQVAIWIDSENAKLVYDSEGAFSIKLIKSNIISRERIPGEGKQFGRFGNQFLSLEKKKTNILKKSIADYLDAIVSELYEAEALVLLGPAEMKKHLKKVILQNDKLAPNTN